MNATVKYLLSGAGQKASLLAGGDGKREQTLGVPHDAPDFAAVVAAGNVAADGTVVLDATAWTAHPGGGYRGRVQPVELDAPATVAEVLSALATRRERLLAEAAQDEAAATERRQREDAEDAAALAAWAALPVSGVTGARVTQADADTSPILTGPAVNRRSAYEAHPAYAEARSEFDRRGAALALRRAAAKDAAALASQERRAALGLAAGDLDLAVENGALTEVPRGCWESHHRGKNWLATITVNPAKPGGLDRNFAAKAHGDAYYLLPAMDVGNAVEFGADYYSGGGRKSPTRWYGYVVRMDRDAGGQVVRLVLHACGTGKAAVKKGQKWLFRF